MPQPTAIDGVRGRDAVERLLPRQAQRAYLVAREIADPWYRCQALTHAAAHLTGSGPAEQALAEALDAASTQVEPNRVVTASAWPISLLVKLNPFQAARHTSRLLQIIAGEAHTLRRADALLHLFEAVFSDPLLRHQVQPLLVAALQSSHGWRAERLTRFTALVVAESSPRGATELLSLLPECRATRRARRMILAGEWLGPHQFIPRYQKVPRGAA